MIVPPLAIFAALAAQAPADRGPRIPLREGLTIVTALNDVRGDYESIKRVTAADGKIVKLAYSADVPAVDQKDNPIAALLGGKCAPDAAARNPDKKIHGTVVRTVRREDLESAHEYRHRFNICAPGEELFPGSTAIGVSAGVLRELKTQGQTRLSVVADGPGAAFTSLIGGLLGGGAPPDLDRAALAAGTLARVERDDVPFKVLVNDEPVELPALHARGRLGDADAEFWILDDAANPLSLRWTIGDRDRLQVIKVFYAPPAAAASPTAARIERDLAKDGRAVVYGIYFDFASDRIKEESEPVLADIAKVLQQHPTWSLAVEGHTDNIGGDAYNLDLSKRRAAAVRQALVARHQIDGKRLQTSGYGASRPKDTNATLEGRARNRRVELMKVG